jgi:hypothetical protein
MKKPHTGDQLVWLRLAEQLSPKHNKLAIIVGNWSTKAMAEEYCLVLDLNVQLSKALLNIPVAKRPRKVKDILDDLLTDMSSPHVCLVGLEVLFEPSLKVQAINLLKQLSHEHVVVAAWPGEFVKSDWGGKLSYGKLGHVEYQEYTIMAEDDFIVIPYQNLVKDNE